jgi:PAS domain S-box-containing protein
MSDMHQKPDHPPGNTAIERSRSIEERLAYYAYLEENTYDAFIVTDENLLVKVWNRGAERMYGWKADEVLGRHIWEAVPLEMSEEERGEVLRELSERGQYRVEAITYAKDGTPVWVEGITIALRGGEPEEDRITSYVNIRRDISERKRFEEEQQCLVNIVQNFSDFVGIADLDWRATFLNEAGQKLVGLDGIEEVRRTWMLDYFMPEDRAFVEELVPVILEEGRWRGELRLRNFQTGEPIPVQWDAFRIDDPDTGEPIGLATVTRDLTETKRAEERLLTARKKERSRIARDLHDEALQDLAGAMAEAQLARRATTGETELSEALKRVEQRIRGAVYDLSLKRERAKPFTELLRDLVELQRSLAADADVRLELEDSEFSELLGDRGRELLRIIGEALANARRHSGARNILVRVWRSGDVLLAEVDDDGRGFDPARVGSATTTGGTSLRGMRERARALGATFKIESEPAMGTRVCFELALKENQEAPGGKVRVLLVEDHAAVREAISSAFEQERGFEVVGQAESLAEARRLLADGPVDVAIVDLGLPDGNGEDLIKELGESNQQTQALVLSASRDHAQIARAVEAGAAGVLGKTTHLDEVVESVRRLRAGETLIPLEEVVELLRFAGTKREEEYEARQAIARLSTREMEVLQLLAQGLDSEGIAEQLHISLRTERNHMASVLRKLGVHSQLQALIFALRYGMVEIP